jgi:predicted DsbA family dithiol-disulfide isomerase
MEAEGLPYGDRQRTFNSRLAQELGKYGDQRGMPQIHDALYRAYFVHGLNLAEADVLVNAAAGVGIAPEEASQVLARRTMRAAVDADWVRSRTLGITGVPTFIVNGQRLVGAQPYEVLEQFVESAGANRKHEPCK